MLRATLKRGGGERRPGLEVRVAREKRPVDADEATTGRARVGADADDDLARRSRDLDTALAAKRASRPGAESSAGTGSAASYAQALRLSSEFIAGIAVGGALGWFVDRVAGTSPWGLIVLLLLGFAAGVLNVLRSAGLVAEVGTRTGKDESDRPGNG